MNHILAKYGNLIFNFLLFVLSMLVNKTGQYNVVEVVNDNKIKNSPLYDVGHNLLSISNPFILKLFCTEKTGLADSITVIILISTSIYLIYKKEIELISNSFLVYAISFFLRTILFNITILPIPKPCHITLFYGGCYDLIYSGHYVGLTTAVYIILYKLKGISIFFKFLVLLLSFINILATITCKNHYSIDVILSIIFTYLICHMIFEKSHEVLKNNKNIGKQ